jgi:ATP-dependent Clp protease adaptor protein ClpS
MAGYYCPATIKEEKMSNVLAAPEVAVNTKIAEPHMFKVVYLDDSVTTVDFVCLTLIEYFQYSEELAEKITLDIHEKGSATVAVLPFELAEQKAVEVTIAARSNRFPLQVRIEPDIAD